MCGHLALVHVAAVSPIRSASVLEGKEGGGVLNYRGGCNHRQETFKGMD